MSNNKHFPVYALIDVSTVLRVVFATLTLSFCPSHHIREFLQTAAHVVKHFMIPIARPFQLITSTTMANSHAVTLTLVHYMVLNTGAYKRPTCILG